MIDMLYDILDLGSLLIPTLIFFDGLQFSIRFVIFFGEFMLTDSIVSENFKRYFES